jgi:hypothetical protein
MAWPAVEIYHSRRPDISFIGQVPTASSTPSWSVRVEDIFPDYVAELSDLIARRPGLCLLFSHTDSDERRREKGILLTANASHTCSEVVRKTGTTLYRCE